LILFLLTIVGISLSGVMSPGPITAATLAAGARNRRAGSWICAGHVAVELPLILLVAAGFGTFLGWRSIRSAIGLVGGALMLLMGVQLLASLRQSQNAASPSAERHPFWIGVVLSIANPYFLLWWATVGFSLIGQALDFGVLAVVLFAIAHWMCDLGWLEALSYAGFRGSSFGIRGEKIISLVCALMLLGFGLQFIVKAAMAAIG
jgi:threonine/homoserine/homoserine lactone efflux protein